MKNPFRWDRTDDEALFNSGAPMHVGGCGPGDDPGKDIMIREPSMQMLYDQYDIIMAALQSLTNLQRDWVDSVVKNPTSFVLSDLKKFGPIVAAAEQLIAIIVQEDPEYVRKQMSAKQWALVGSFYLRVIGIDTIRELFLSGKAHFVTVMKTPAKSEAGFDPSHAQ